MKNPPYIWVKQAGRGWRRKHRVIMERALERLLRPDEIVHHRNGDVADNRPGNLQLLTRGEHATLHLRGKPVVRRPPTEEHRAKIAASLRGRRVPDEMRARISRTMKGRRPTTEHRANVSSAMKRHWARRRRLATDGAAT